MPIRIVPARLDWLTALAEGDAVFSERFGVRVEPGWVGFPEALPYAVDAARAHDADTIADPDGGVTEEVYPWELVLA
jgi:hypothetical protein